MACSKEIKEQGYPCIEDYIRKQYQFIPVAQERLKEPTSVFQHDRREDKGQKVVLGTNGVMDSSLLQLCWRQHLKKILKKLISIVIS